MGKQNIEFRQKVKDAGLTICELGYAAGLSEATTFRWLRYPLDSNKKQILMNALNNLKPTEV